MNTNLFTSNGNEVFLETMIDEDDNWWYIVDDQGLRISMYMLTEDRLICFYQHNSLSNGATLMPSTT